MEISSHRESGLRRSQRTTRPGPELAIAVRALGCAVPPWMVMDELRQLIAELLERVRDVQVRL
jgi:hypothetical protein